MKTRVFEYYNFRLCKPQLSVQVWRENDTYWCGSKEHTLKPHWDNIGIDFDVADYETARRNALHYSQPEKSGHKEHVVFEDGKVVA